MQDNPQYDNVIDTLLAFFETKINVALKHKISNSILDPGIGFGKTLRHNLHISQLRSFKNIGLSYLYWNIQ